MDLLKLFSPAYLFDAFPGAEFPSRVWVYGFFLVLFLLGLVLPRYLKNRPQAKMERVFFGGIPYRLCEFAVVGLFFTFLRDQNVPYLGMRVWMLAVGLFLLIYLLYVWRNYRKNFATVLLAKESKKEVDKYQPKKKTRK
ncbi:hypothetical protein IPG41_01545 [Candidatus Peregrinibacteria bacterium]|nr:MAG: hypothetical protein IPG41_01545 [Candidatus Peregrinibacteria bacterium]